MENVSNIQGISRRQSYAPAQNSSDFAFLMSYLFQSRYYQNLGDNSMKQTLLNHLRSPEFSSFFNQIFENLTKTSLDILAQTSQRWGIENMFLNLNITSANWQLQDNFNRLSQHFNIAIQLYGNSNFLFNMTTGGSTKRIKIYYDGQRFYACVSKEEDILLNENINQGIKPDLFNGIVEGFQKIIDFIRPDDKEAVVNILEKCKTKKELAENAETLKKMLIDCGKCANHDFVCFECKIVHCKTCFMNRYQGGGIKDCFCGKTVSMSFLNTILGVTVPRQISNDSAPAKGITPPPKRNLDNFNAGVTPRPQNFNEDTKKIESSYMQNPNSNLPGAGTSLLPPMGFGVNNQNIYNQPGVQNPLLPPMGFGVNNQNIHNQPGVQNPLLPTGNSIPNFRNQPDAQNAPGPFQASLQNAAYYQFMANPQANYRYSPNQNQCCICLNSFDQANLSIICQEQHIYCNNCHQLSSNYCSVCFGWKCYICQKYVLVNEEKFEVENYYIHKICYISSFR